MSDTAVAVVLGGAFVAALLFVGCLVGTFIGLVVGFVVGVTPLGPFVTDGFNAFGFQTTGLLPQIGAAAGFVGGLIGGGIFSKSKKDD